MASQKEFNIIVFCRVKFRVLRKYINLIYHLETTFNFLYLKYRGVDTKYGYVELKGLPIIHKVKGSKIILGKGTTIISNSKYNIAGINHRTILATLSEKAVIQINRAGISGATICAAKGVYIGEYVGIGANSKLYDTDFHPINPIKRQNQKSITDAQSEIIYIENNVWISSDVTVLKGVTLGQGAVIGASSVVTRNIPEFVVAAGNPARFIRNISFD
jgi:acetyltransferase-like isoleucine patch superfamily enzyme